VSSECAPHDESDGAALRAPAGSGWLAGGRCCWLERWMDGWMDGGHRIAFIGEILLQHRHIRL
jgi:hypothetical protein